MKPSIKKAASRKTVRVATTFTGAAACAVTFAPTVAAGTGQPAAAQPGHQHKVHRIQAITQANCRGTNQSHWMHMGTETTVTCFGFRGATHVRPNPFKITSFCGGNNSGFIYGTSAGGNAASIFFGHGTYYNQFQTPSPPLHASFVSIIGFGGNDKCPATG
jgi:hypothetical protein